MPGFSQRLSEIEHPGIKTFDENTLGERTDNKDYKHHSLSRLAGIDVSMALAIDVASLTILSQPTMRS
jgi:hypothetical protein